MYCLEGLYPCLGMSSPVAAPKPKRPRESLSGQQEFIGDTLSGTPVKSLRAIELVNEYRSVERELTDWLGVPGNCGARAVSYTNKRIANMGTIVDRLVAEFVALEKSSDCAERFEGRLERVLKVVETRDRWFDQMDFGDYGAVCSTVRGLKKDVEEGLDKLNATVGSLKEDLRKGESGGGRVGLVADGASGTYASAVGAKPRRNAVLLVPTSDSGIASAKDAEDRLMAGLNPREEGWNVVKVRRRNDRGLVIDVARPEDQESIVGSAKVRELGFSASELKKKRPCVVVRGVPNDRKDEEVLEEFSSTIGMERQAFISGFRVLYKLGRPDHRTRGWVVEMSQQVYSDVMKHGSLCVGWTSCRVQDFLSVVKCFRCQGFGHTSLHCKMAANSCGHCGVEGHIRSACPSVQSVSVCPTCRHFGKIAAHEVGVNNCPEYKRLANWAKLNTDYGK